jgi:hypothetical protein
MRLSEEIVLGSTVIKRGLWLRKDEDAGCVLQMAMVAAGEKKDTFCMGSTMRRHRWTLKETSCPECGQKDNCAAIIGIHLNDRHEWSVEEIANWVRSIEPAETEQLSEDTEWFKEQPCATTTCS